MGNKGYSRKGFFGTIHHYDEHGRKTGHSTPGFFGSYTNYDEHGRKTGHSSPGFFGSYNHYDNSGRKTGSSHESFFGSYNHYDKNGKQTGHSDPGLFDSYHHSSGGCYVATCVYGSYDCPEVWTLRRYRDFCLSKTWYGRAFIRLYYAVSPTVVKIFGCTKLFKNFWKKHLDKMVEKLQSTGYASTPYKDRTFK